MKLHATELARITKHQRLPALIQNEVVVLPLLKISWRYFHSSSHAKMQAEPVLVRKSEQHPFATRDRANQT